MNPSDEIYRIKTDILPRLNKSVKNVYFVKFGPDYHEFAMVSDRPKEEWEFGTKIKIYSSDDFWKMAKRRQQWFFFFNHKNPEYLVAMKRLSTAPKPHAIREIFGLPDGT